MVQKGEKSANTLCLTNVSLHWDVIFCTKSALCLFQHGLNIKTLLCSHGLYQLLGVELCCLVLFTKVTEYYFVLLEALKENSINFMFNTRIYARWLQHFNCLKNINNILFLFLQSWLLGQCILVDWWIICLSF